jgi:hypothetical protein
MSMGTQWPYDKQLLFLQMGLQMDEKIEDTSLQDITSCSLAEVDWHFRGAYYLHHHPDDGSNMHPWNMRLYSTISQKAIIFILFHVLDRFILLTSCGLRLSHWYFRLSLVRDLIQDVGWVPWPQTIPWERKILSTSLTWHRTWESEFGVAFVPWKIRKCKVGLCVYPCYRAHHTKLYYSKVSGTVLGKCNAKTYVSLNFLCPKAYLVGLVIQYISLSITGENCPWM